MKDLEIHIVTFNTSIMLDFEFHPLSGVIIAGAMTKTFLSSGLTPHPS
jgi:hypothetical protein